MALTRHEIASLNRVASIPEALASTDYATASTNSSQFVPDVEAVEAVEANPHTIRGPPQSVSVARQVEVTSFLAA